jgi:hypothetical protein
MARIPRIGDERLAWRSGVPIIDQLIIRDGRDLRCRARAPTETKLNLENPPGLCNPLKDDLADIGEVKDHI